MSSDSRAFFVDSCPAWESGGQKMLIMKQIPLIITFLALFCVFGEAADFWVTDGVRNLYSGRAIVTSYAGVANLNGYSVRCLRD